MIKMKQVCIKENILLNYVGYAAAVIGLTAYGPLIWDVFFQSRTHTANYVWLVLQFIAMALWVWYGYMTQSVHTIASGSLAMLIITGLTIYKIYLETTNRNKK
jgi:uncharacterized protein with PQ loop repeat